MTFLVALYAAVLLVTLVVAVLSVFTREREADLSEWRTKHYREHHYSEWCDELKQFDRISE